MKAWTMSVAALMVCAAGAMACPDKENGSKATAAAAETASLTLVSGEGQPECSAHALVKAASAEKTECSKAGKAQTAALSLVTADGKIECSAHAAGIQQVAASKTECSKAQQANTAALSLVAVDGKSECSSKAAALTQVAADKPASCCAQGVSKAAALLTVAADSKPECSAGKGIAPVTQVSFQQAALLEMPALMYLIGSEKTSCSESAAKLVETHGTAMRFEVGGREFESKGEAYQAHTAELNAYLDTMTRVSFVVGDNKVDCPIEASAKSAASGQAMKYRVGPAVFASAERAIHAAALAYGASRQISMTYEVGDTATSCSVEAGQCSKDSGQAIQYVIGDRRTDCPVTAAEILATKRVQAALDAIESAQG